MDDNAHRDEISGDLAPEIDIIAPNPKQAEMLRRDYRINKRRSLDRAEYAIKRLKRHFANQRALDVTDNELNAYVDERLEGDRAANASVHYEIAMIKRMYRLAGKILGGYRQDHLVVFLAALAAQTRGIGKIRLT